MSAAPGDLCVLADVKEYLNIKTVTDDAFLQRLITSCSSRIGQYLQRTIGSGATVTEVRNGSGTSQMFLTRWPVTAVTSVTVNNVAIQAASPQGSAGYVIQVWDGVTVPIKEPVLMLTGGYGIWQGQYGPGGYGCFPVGNANVTIVYTAGFATVPPDISQACIELVGQTYKQKDRLAQNTVNQATQSVSFITALLPSVKEALNPYRRVTPLML